MGRTLVMGRRLYKGCLLCLAGSMISGAGAAGRAIGEQLEKPDTHAMATYIKRLMKRDGQEDWANEVLDWDKRNTFDLKRLMRRGSFQEDSNGHDSPVKRDSDNTNGFAPQRLMKKDINGFAPKRLMKKDFEGFAPQRLMKKGLEGFSPQRLMKKDLQGFPPKRLMKKDLDSFGLRRLMKKEESGFSTHRLMKKGLFDEAQAFGPRRLMKKDLDGFDLQRLTKKDFDPKRLMKKELWSTRLIRREAERPAMPLSWRVIDLPTNSEVWEPIAEIHEPTEGHNWRIEW